MSASRKTPVHTSPVAERLLAHARLCEQIAQTEAALAGAPERLGDHFLVPAILGDAGAPEVEP
jgi:hypothetical protein